MFNYFPSGDSALIIKAGNEISEEINRSVRKLLIQIERENIDGIIDFIPSYNELMICYDPLKTGFKKLLDTLHPFEAGVETIELPESSVIEIPVLYGGESGPDLNDVAIFNNLSPDDVVNTHCSASYLVYMLGFTPGFCYLGGMDQRISMPRKKTPRLRIPAGSVGIADGQTGIYPIDSPGGWQLIGITPFLLFDPGHKPEFPVRAGDHIKFCQVNQEEYADILRERKKEFKR